MKTLCKILLLFYRLQRLEDYFAIAFLFFFIFGYFIKETFYKGSITETSKGAVLKGGESWVPSHPVYEGGRGKCWELWRGGPPDGAMGRGLCKGASWEDSSGLTLRHSLGLLLVPPISQTQPGARIQGIPGRGPLRLLFFLNLVIFGCAGSSLLCVGIL